MAQKALTGSFGDDVEAIPGLAQFNPGTLEAMLHVRQGGLRIGADCDTVGPGAACGLLLGHLAIWQ
eukprot:3964600-Alexandrium_andersonii.AAC.1